LSRKEEKGRPPNGGLLTCNHDPKRRFAHYQAHPWSMAGPLIFGACLFTALAIGWFNRGQEYLIPDDGAGY
jgi:hypothetical protein